MTIDPVFFSYEKSLINDLRTFRHMIGTNPDGSRWALWIHDEYDTEPTGRTLTEIEGVKVWLLVDPTPLPVPPILPPYEGINDSL
jgi:hypothetical protein